MIHGVSPVPQPWPSAPMPTPKRRIHWLSWVIGGVGVLCGGIGLIVGAANSTTTQAQAPGATHAPTTEAAHPPATTSPVTGISGDGTYLVPAEAKPGTYRAVVPADSTGCYWARLKATDGSFDSILANDTGNAGATMTVTILPTDKAFQTTGCGPWAKVG